MYLVDEWHNFQEQQTVSTLHTHEGVKSATKPCENGHSTNVPRLAYMW
jgi:hypothetical protein